MRRARALLLLAAAALFGPVQADASEARATRALEAVRASPLELQALLREMPKGADLHMHLSGSVYAETLIREAASESLCINPDAGKFEIPSSADGAAPVCPAGDVAAEQALRDQRLYDSLVDALSMRAHVPADGHSGHDHFFATFSRFEALDWTRVGGEWLDEVATRAADQNQQYLEAMISPTTPRVARIAALVRAVGWNDDFAAMVSAMEARGLAEEIEAGRADISANRAGIEAARAKAERCGAPDAAPACAVETRFLMQLLRGLRKELVFAQALLGFAAASADPRIVGVNFVMPEDGLVSMRDYALHMRMFGFLHQKYPNVHISLHAGELAPGLAPPEGLRDHIRLAVEEGHAERIGHGVDVMYETDPRGLMKEMAARGTMVEICLTSNDGILGVRGVNHPFPLYRKAGVPVALATDDQGVSRIDLTYEFARAVQSYGLTYPDLKRLARTSVEHAFLPGASLWRDPDGFTRPVAACANDSDPSPPCKAFLAGSEKAAQQFELERRFRAFEAKF